MISLMTYVSAERAGHATESRKITLPLAFPPRTLRFFTRVSPATRAINALSNEVANVGVKLSEGVELPNIDVATNVITLKLITVESR